MRDTGGRSGAPFLSPLCQVPLFHASVCLYIYIYIYVCVCACITKCVYFSSSERWSRYRRTPSTTYIYIYMFVCVYIYIYVCIHIHCRAWDRLAGRSRKVALLAREFLHRGDWPLMQHRLQTSKHRGSRTARAWISKKCSLRPGLLSETTMWAGSSTLHSTGHLVELKLQVSQLLCWQDYE